MAYDGSPEMELVQMAARRKRVGLWMIGACGGVGSTVALGITALGKRLVPTTGLVTDLPAFREARLADPGSIVIGGHEIRAQSLLEAVEASRKKASLFDPDVIKACTPKLRALQRDIRPGTLCGAGPTIRGLADDRRVVNDRSPADAVERISSDITGFRKKRDLDVVVVMHIASSEPPAPKAAKHRDFRTLRQALARPRSRVLPTSSLYALAALQAGCPFVNFTPSLGINVPAIRKRADQLGLPYMGRDGKTGETLIKSVLAPMFKMRHLSILSWVGQNILGNRDGTVLSDPETRLSKIQSKDKLAQIVGGKPTTRVSIDYVSSLDDWKVAWDFIHFEGFLGTKMNMQFTWCGSDSILAAPLVIDLTRLAALEYAAGRGGPMHHLAFFFKDPIDAREHDLFTQWERLVAHVAGSPRET